MNHTHLDLEALDWSPRSNYMFVSDDAIYSFGVTIKELGEHVATPCSTPYSP